MKENKLDTITNLFEGSEIRSILNKEKEEESELHEKIVQLKLMSKKIIKLYR